MDSINNIKKRVVSRLQNELDDSLLYHSVDHTLYVYEKAQIIGSKEGVSKKEMKLLKIAALYHDIGHIYTYQDHEEMSCKILKKELRSTLDKKDIKTICGMIMATKIPQNPKTLLENIIADADLEYLGTKYFYKTGNLLYLELKHRNPKLTQKDWDKIQIGFLTQHSYHTKFCKQYKEKYKQKYLSELVANNK